MAFNPFEAFSIRSKIGRSVMAVLGIVVMLTFVLSSGAVGSGNDFFDQLGGLFGSGKKGEVVAKAYGDDIRDTDLNEIHSQRRAARRYLGMATAKSYTHWAEKLGNDVRSGSVSPETRAAVEPFANVRATAETKPQAYGQFLREFFQFQSEPQRKFSDALQRARLKPESDDKKILDAMVAIILFDKGAMPIMYPVMELRDSDQDAVNFALLLKKADQMGIRYSKEAVIDLVNRDMAVPLSVTDRTAIDDAVRYGDQSRGPTMTAAALEQAIANEYRVQAVLRALQGKSVIAEIAREGRGQGMGQMEQIILQQFFRINPFELPAPGDRPFTSAYPGAVTPYEFFEFYKDRCTENTFQVLEVNADTKAFLDQVTGEPTAKERTDLFTKYKGDLPDPSKDRPGFKEPRKLKVEFVTLDGNAPRIAQGIPKIQAASLFLCASGGAIAGNPAMALAAAAQPSMAETLPLREALSEKMDEVLHGYRPHELWFFTPRDTSIYRPQPIISALGILAGNPDVASFAAAVASVHQHVERFDHHVRIPFLLQPVLTPFNPTLGNALGMPAFALALNPKLPPEGLYLPKLTADLKKKQRQKLFLSDVQELQASLRKITSDQNLTFGQKPEKAKEEKSRAEAKKLLEDWAKDRGLTIAGTAEPRDQFAIVSDAALKPLNDAALPEPDGSNSLSQKLFPPQDPRMRFPADVQPFHPDWFPSDPGNTLELSGLEKPSHLVWISQEVDPRTFNNLENATKLTNGEIIKRIDRAWRLEKAKALAKAEADRLADEVRKIAKTVSTDPLGVERQLRDLALQKNDRMFELSRLAPMQFEHGATTPEIRYKPPTIEKSQVLYPTPDFTGKLLELRKEPLGTVTVLPDAPKTRYYVACVTARSEKTIDQFRNVYDKSTAVLGKNPLYDQALGEERFKAMPEVFDRLRAEAGLELKEAFKNRERKESE
ncbi:MAG TPA: hypothetical protein VHR66_23355 [Gemmataceae bacterium]|jgi:hypothetical protein|nr:hypothetical protein [Gemmataceae bacterium]